MYSDNDTTYHLATNSAAPKPKQPDEQDSLNKTDALNRQIKKDQPYQSFQLKQPMTYNMKYSNAVPLITFLGLAEWAKRLNKYSRFFIPRHAQLPSHQTAYSLDWILHRLYCIAVLDGPYKIFCGLWTMFSGLFGKFYSRKIVLQELRASPYARKISC